MLSLADIDYRQFPATKASTLAWLDRMQAVYDSEASADEKNAQMFEIMSS